MTPRGFVLDAEIVSKLGIMRLDKIIRNWFFKTQCHLDGQTLKAEYATRFETKTNYGHTFKSGTAPVLLILC